MKRELETVPGTNLQYEYHRPARVTSPYPLLFNHGMFGGSWVFRLSMEYALLHGFEVYALNLEGHAPGQRVGASSIDDYVENHLAMLKYIGRPTITINHSMGGLIGLLAAERLSRDSIPLVKGIILLSSMVPGKFFFRKEILCWCYLKAMATRKPFWPKRNHLAGLFVNHTPQKEKDLFLSAFTRGSGMALRQIATSLLLVDERQIFCPGLVISGSHDKMAPPHRQFQMAEKFHFDYDRVDEGDHMTCMWSVDPIDRVIRWIYAKKLCHPGLDLELADELCLKA